MQHSRTFSLAIDRPWTELYAFLADPRTINRWTQGVIAAPLVRLSDYEWQAMQDGQPVSILFTPPNSFGVLDVVLRWENQPPRHFVVRLFPNEEGSELCFTLFQRPGETDAQFASECEWLRTDLGVLKTYVERA